MNSLNKHFERQFSVSLQIHCQNLSNTHVKKNHNLCKENNVFVIKIYKLYQMKNHYWIGFFFLVANIRGPAPPTNLKRFSSLENLSTMPDPDPEPDPDMSASFEDDEVSPQPRMARRRGGNESFRAAVDRSYDPVPKLEMDPCKCWHLFVYQSTGTSSVRLWVTLFVTSRSKQVRTSLVIYDWK